MRANPSSPDNVMRTTGAPGATIGPTSQNTDAIKWSPSLPVASLEPRNFYFELLRVAKGAHRAGVTHITVMADSCGGPSQARIAERGMMFLRNTCMDDWHGMAIVRQGSLAENIDEVRSTFASARGGFAGRWVSEFNITDPNAITVRTAVCDLA